MAEKPAFPAEGEWPCFRGNDTLDGWAALRGALRQPQVVWRHFLGSTSTGVELRPGTGNSQVAIPAGAPILFEDLAADLRWGLQPPERTIEGRPQRRSATVTTTYARIFPHLSGLQKIEFESGFSKPTPGGQWADCYGRCFEWANGEWQLVWQTEPVHYLFQPLPLVGDFDGDGALEIAVLPWYELLLFDAQTGCIKDRCAFTDGRSYGFFGAYDLDGDGLTEFVVQADYAKHVDVLGFRDGRLTLLWRKAIELDFNDPQKILRVGPNPVADVDGDGRIEVLINLFNDTGDGRWHVLVCDGITGEVRLDLPNQHLAAAMDVDGDGRAELLTARTTGGAVPEYGGATVWKAPEGRQLWAAPEAGWQYHHPPLPAHVNSGATLAARTVLARRTAAACHVVMRHRRARDAGDTATVTLRRWGEEGFETVAHVTGPRMEGKALADDGSLLLTCLTVPGLEAAVTATGARLYALGQWAEPGPSGPVAVTRRADERPLVVVQAAAEELALLSVAGAGQPVEVRRFAGRATGDSWDHRLFGPVVANLNGDGGRQLLYATAAPGGCARLVCANLDGSPLWAHDFPEMPGSAPVWNTGGIIHWQTGHFTHPVRRDVVVTLRASLMHSEETRLLDGRDGHELWRRRRGVTHRIAEGELISRAVGGAAFAIADLDGDGLDDLALAHPSVFHVVRGATGEDVIALEARWPEVAHDLVYWGQLVAGPWLSPGRTDCFFTSSNGSMTGVITPDGKLAWWDAFHTGPHGLHAFGDFDGDGRPEALGVGYWDPAGPIDAVRCYDCATGRVKWTLPFAGHEQIAGCASADLDGDGCTEAVFSIGNRLVCFGTGPECCGGALRWTLTLPAALSAPAIGDADGSGRASVLVTAADGFLYCIG